MSRARPDVVYVQPGVPRVYEIVNAIVKSGYSCRYLSGYYYRENGLPERLLRLLPQRWTAGIFATMKRRHLAHLPPEIVERSWVVEILLGIERKFRFLLPNFIMTKSRYFDLRGALRVRMLRPKIVIGCDSHALYTLRAAKKVGAIAILDQVIGHVDAGNKILSEEKALHPEIGSAFRPTAPRMVRRCIEEVREADYIFVPSDYVRESITPFGADPARIFMLPYGVNLTQFAPTPERPVPPFNILFAGHIGMRKGVLYLLEAVRRIDNPDLHVILLGNIEGDGEWLRPYDGLFTHLRHLPHQEIPAVFADAHIYVYPSLHEGSTVSIYEAMASGLPVVTTPNAGSVVRDGTDGFIVPVRDVDATRDRIERLYRDPALRAAMAESTAARAADYSWDSYGRRVGEALSGILKERVT